MTLLNKFYYLILIFICLLKISFAFFFGDNNLEAEWYIRNQNLINYNSFLYHQIDGEFVPSIYMPPLYSYFIYFFKLNLNYFITVKLILVFQCIISIFSVIFFLKILKNILIKIILS